MTPAKPRATLPRMKVKIRHLVELPGAADTMRYYWQPAAKLRQSGWLLVRLPDRRADAIARAEELNAQLDAWRRGEALPHGPTPIEKVQPGTLGAVIASYKASRFFKKLAPRTQKGYLQNIKILEAWGGTTRAAAIKRPNVQKLYESIYSRAPAQAAAVVTMLRILLEFAGRLGLVTENAAARAGVVGSAPSGRIWPRAAIPLFVAAADAAGWHSIGTYILINHWFGQRKDDILYVQRSAVVNGELRLAQHKTGARVQIPDNPEIAARIQQELDRHKIRVDRLHNQGVTPLDRPELLLCETTGARWGEDHFNHIFAEIRAQVAAAHPTIAHADGSEEDTARLLLKHLRHTAVTELAIAGATPPQIAAITGHTLASVNTILARYLVMCAPLAAEAMALRMAYYAQQDAKQATGGTDAG